MVTQMKPSWNLLAVKLALALLLPGLGVEIASAGQPLEVTDIRRVSIASDGSQANGRSDAPSISADGRLIAFASEADNFVSGDRVFPTHVPHRSRGL